MNAVEKELQKATGVTPKPGEKRSKYLDRISSEAEKLSDAKYNALSEGAQKWLDAAAEEYKKATARGKDPLIEDFEDDGSAPEPALSPPKAAKAPKAKAAAKSAPVEEGDEDDGAGTTADAKPGKAPA